MSAELWSSRGSREEPSSFRLPASRAALLHPGAQGSSLTFRANREQLPSDSASFLFVPRLSSLLCQISDYLSPVRTQRSHLRYTQHPYLNHSCKAHLASIQYHSHVPGIRTWVPFRATIQLATEYLPLSNSTEQYLSLIHISEPTRPY